MKWRYKQGVLLPGWAANGDRRTQVRAIPDTHCNVLQIVFFGKECKAMRIKCARINQKQKILWTAMNYRKRKRRKCIMGMPGGKYMWTIKWEQWRLQDFFRLGESGSIFPDKRRKQTFLRTMNTDFKGNWKACDRTMEKVVVAMHEWHIVYMQVLGIEETGYWQGNLWKMSM